jgi:hypothetical protein
LPGEIFQATGSPLFSYPGLPPVGAWAIHVGALNAPPGDLAASPTFNSFFDVFVEIDFAGFPAGTAPGLMHATGTTDDPPLPASRAFDPEMVVFDLFGRCRACLRFCSGKVPL